MAPLESPPSQVLDVGCGTYASWILSAAKWPGWHETRFVGLDIAPVLVPASMVAADSAARISFVQRDFLQPLPFHDGQFSYIRCGHISAGIPGKAALEFPENVQRLILSIRLHRAGLGSSGRGTAPLSRSGRNLGDCRNGATPYPATSASTSSRVGLAASPAQSRFSLAGSRHPRDEQHAKHQDVSVDLAA